MEISHFALFTDFVLCNVMLRMYVIRRYLKIILFLVDRPGEFILRAYLAAFFFFFFFLNSLIFQSFFVRFSNGFHHCTQDGP